MKCITRITSFALLTSALVISNPVLAASKYHRIIWDQDPSTHAVIGFTPDGVSTSPYVLYGSTTDESLWSTQVVTDSQTFRGSLKSNFVRLNNLTPDSAIYYRVCDDLGCGERLWFKTAPVDDSPYVVVAGGDTRTGLSNRRRGNTLISKIRPLFIMHGGDFTDANSAAQMKTWLNDWNLTFSDDVIDGVTYKRVYPLIPTHGNHEDGDSRTLCRVFGTDFNKDNQCDVTDTYGAFNVSPLLRAYTLNTQLGGAQFAGMNNWLDNDLISNGASGAWRIAQYHKPMFPHTRDKSENQRLFDGWAQNFYDNAMNIVVESDSHVAKVTKALRPSGRGFVETIDGGTVYVGEGSWGAPARSANDGKSWTLGMASIQQFKVITVSQDTLEVRTAQFNAGASTLSREARVTDSTALPTGINWWKPRNVGEVLLLTQNADNRSVIASDVTNLPPEVNAGSDRTVKVGVNTSLQGTVNDDGLPNPPSVLTSIWSKVSGPGIVSFGDDSLASTTGRFSEVGVYTLQLSADDTALTASDIVQITVTTTGGSELTVVTVVASDAQAAEAGRDPGTFTFSRTGSTSTTLTLRYTVSGSAVNGTDYDKKSGIVRIRAGQSSRTITIKPKDDSAVEEEESVIVTLTPNSAYEVGASAAATVTISDNDVVAVLPVVTVVASDALAAEAGRDAGTLTFSRTGDTRSALGLGYTLSGTATNGADYDSKSGIVTIKAGQSSRIISIKPKNDSTVEEDETVIVTLSTNAAYEIGATSNATVTIIDNDAVAVLPVITVVATDASASEAGSNPGAFTFSRSGDTRSTLRLRYTLSGNATNGSDYDKKSGIVSIRAGQSSRTISIKPKDDTAVENDENVIVTLSADAAYEIGAANEATVTIEDNDTAGGGGTGLLGQYSQSGALKKVSFIKGDLSGNAYDAETNTMYLVANKGNKVWQVDMQFNRLRTINTNGFGDSEDIVHLGGNEFAIIEERKSQLYIGTILPSATSINVADFQTITFDGNVGNSGYEGVAFDPATNRFWVIKEKGPKKILSFIRPSSPANVNLRGTPELTVPFNANSLPASDLSSIHFDRRTGNLLIVSHEKNKVMEVTQTGEVLSTLTLPGGKQFEGITAGANGDIVVTSEPNLYTVYTQQR